MKSVLLLLLSIFHLSFLSAQSFNGDFEFGKVSQTELDMSIYANDSSANAVVLNEYGRASIDFNSDYSYRVYFYHHYRIKILNKQGFSQANIEIPLRKQGENSERTFDIKAITINNKDQSPFDTKSIFIENESKYLDIKKFTLPSIKEGSIIEVSYMIESPFYFNFQTWDFQSEIPKVKSEFWAQIPATFDYNISLRGFQTLSKNEMERVRECIAANGGIADCSLLKFAMKDIPAFMEEDYMTSKNNFLSSINFELKEYRSFNGNVHKYSKEWKDVDKELKDDEKFGAQIKKGLNNFWEERLGPSLVNITDTLDRAKRVYDFVKGWYTWNNYYGMYCDNGIKKAYDLRSGDIADINLSLISALRYAGIDAQPIILSTRNNGLPTELFPVISNFNYVIGICKIKGKNYFLDATEKLLPFGMLPARCLNGKGRLISTSFKSDWIEIPNKEKTKKISLINLKLEENGSFKGTLSNIYYGYKGFLKREEISKFNNTEEYVQSINEKMDGIKILKHTIDNIAKLDTPLFEVFEIEIKGFDDLDGSHFLINPFIFDRLKENPFKSNERLYPVDYGLPYENKVLFQLEYPANFTITNIPQKVNLALPENGGKYLFNIQPMENKISFTNVFSLNRAIYSSEEYHYLKELYNRMVQNQSTDIILEKKK